MIRLLFGVGLWNRIKEFINCSGKAYLSDLLVSLVFIEFKNIFLMPYIAIREFPPLVVISPKIGGSNSRVDHHCFLRHHGSRRRRRGDGT
jgi:hypothetical protein